MTTPSSQVARPILGDTHAPYLYAIAVKFDGASQKVECYAHSRENAKLIVKAHGYELEA